MLRFNKIFFVVIFLFATNSVVFGFQFGNGNNDSTMTFIKVADDVKDVCLGNWKSFIIKNDNSLWGTGEGIYKQFGISGPKIEKKFVKLEENIVYFNGFYYRKKDGSVYLAENGIKKIYDDIIKYSYGLFKTSDGKLWAKGKNNYGAFGIGINNADLSEPTLIMNNCYDFFSNGYFSQVINKDYELYVSGSHYLPEPYKKSNTFFKIAENVRYSTAGFYITNKNELYAFGWCGYGASGLGNLGNQYHILPTKIMDDVLTVESNQQVTLIIKTNGDLYGCGGDTPNYAGELGIGSKNPVYKPILIMKNVEKVSLGISQAAVLKKDGSLWMCGANDYFGGL